MLLTKRKLDMENLTKFIHNSFGLNIFIFYQVTILHIKHKIYTKS
jgi:hypothetical protein